MDKETKLLLRTLLLIVEKDKGKKDAKAVKKAIFKLTVKTLVLYNDKKIQAKEFSDLGGLFRRICSATRNGYRTGSIDKPTAERIAGMAQSFFNSVMTVLRPWLSKKTMDLAQYLLSYLGTAEFLVRASKMKEFEEIARVLASYLMD